VESNAGVCDFEHRVIVGRDGAYLHLAAFASILDCVVYKIDDYLFQAMGVAFNFNAARALHFTRFVYPRRGGAFDLQCRRQARRGRIARASSKLPRVEARDCQQALDDLRKTLGFLERAAIVSRTSSARSGR